MSIRGPIRALVLEGSQNSALTIVRSLGRMGAHVTVGDHARHSPSALSRYARKRILYPNPKKNVRTFLDFLADHVRRHRYDVVMPVSDFTVLPIAQRRHDFEPHTRLGVAPTDQLLTAHDKAKTVEHAQQCGVACPETHVPLGLDELEHVAAKLAYPVVVKPRSKVTWSEGVPVVNIVTLRNFVSTPDELRARYEEIHRVSPFPLIQEMIRGDGFGFFALMVNGEPKAVAGHRRLREYPLSGGMSTFRESYLDEELEQSGRRVLEAIGWDGVAMVEFKKDRRDGSYKLMEINGRWWGSLALAVAAGVDFPQLYCRYLLDGDLDAGSSTFRPGVRCRALLPWDLLWLAARMRQKDRMAALLDWLRPDGLHFDVLSISDPLPAVGMCLRTLGYVSKVISRDLMLKFSLLHA